MTLADRLFGRVLIDQASGCWLWTGARSAAGYGQMRVDGRTLYVHRLAWEMLRGPISPGLVLDHLCRIHNCMNPGHLEPVSQRVNILRGTSKAVTNAAKAVCDNGNEFSGENTYVRKDSGGRQCRVCGRERRQNHRDKVNARERVRRATDPEHRARRIANSRKYRAALKAAQLRSAS
jgi:HNH endonuclease